MLYTEGLQIDGFDAQNMFRNNQFTIKPFLSYDKYWAFCISYYLTFDRQFIFEMKCLILVVAYLNNRFSM